ncbi:MAG: LTA synthase family protein, partial [Spirochaetota bacterium]|nr:LTA synthase family protein [Spirochaetota bacterium]
MGRWPRVLLILEIVVLLVNILSSHYFNYYGVFPQYREALLFTALFELGGTVEQELPLVFLALELLLMPLALFFAISFLKKRFQLSKPKKVRLTGGIFALALSIPFLLSVIGVFREPAFVTKHLQKEAVNHLASSIVEELISKLRLEKRMAAINFSRFRAKLYDQNSYRYPLEHFPLMRAKLESSPADQSVIKKPGKYNVVFLVMESLSSIPLGKKVNGMIIGKSLAEIRDQGLSFNYLYASGNDSAQGLEALYYSSHPKTMDLLKHRPQRNVSLVNIVRDNGYETGVFSSVKAGWFFTQWMLESIGHEFYYGLRKHIARHGDKDKLSDDFLADHAVLESMLEYMKAYKKDKPFFLSFISIVNHSPYKIYPKTTIPKIFAQPANRMEHYINSYNYSAESVAMFIKNCRQLPNFKDTIFVIVADHRPHGIHFQRFPGQKVNKDFFRSYSLPFILYNPHIIKKNKKIANRSASQLDIAPTLTHILGLQDARNMFMGQSLVSTKFYDSRYIMLPGKRMALSQGHAINRGEVYRLSKDHRILGPAISGKDKLLTG